MGRAWTDAELAEVRALYPTTPNSEIARVFAEKFAPGRLARAIELKANSMGIYKAEGCVKPQPNQLWTPERRDWAVAFIPGHEESEISAEHERVFGTPLSEHQIGYAKARFGVKSGTHGGQWKKGRTSPNKGKKWVEYMSPEAQERARRTGFQVGNYPKNAQDKPIGYERVGYDGYVWVKVALHKSRPGCNDNWRQKHHLAWEQHHGRPVPKDCQIVFANHDKTDFSPENLVAVPRDIWVRIIRSGYEYYDAASLGACVNLARLKSRLYNVKIENHTCKRCGCRFVARYQHQRTCDTCLGRE